MFELGDMESFLWAISAALNRALCPQSEFCSLLHTVPTVPMPKPFVFTIAKLAGCSKFKFRFRFDEFKVIFDAAPGGNPAALYALLGRLPQPTPL